MKRLLEGQVALITGASSGIGRGCSIELGRAGAKVVINYIGNPDGANVTLDAVKAAGGEGIIVKGDVSKEADVIAMFAEAIKTYGTVDILVANAGLQKGSPFIDMTVEQWDFVMDVNLKGQFLCAREAARGFIKRGKRDVSASLGKIICMSSVHELIPWAGESNYAASKGGVMLMMKSIAQELGMHKIRVNSIAPGAIKTPINTKAWDTPEAEDKLLQLIPYGRVGETSDIGKVCVWLASDDSEYIQGQTIFVDGGMALYPGFKDNG